MNILPAKSTNIFIRNYIDMYLDRLYICFCIGSYEVVGPLFGQISSLVYCYG